MDTRRTIKKVKKGFLGEISRGQIEFRKKKNLKSYSNFWEMRQMEDNKKKKIPQMFRPPHSWSTVYFFCCCCPRQSFLHKSRHDHACRRVRGPGGRFLTKAELNQYRKQLEAQDPEGATAPAPLPGIGRTKAQVMGGAGFSRL